MCVKAQAATKCARRGAALMDLLKEEFTIAGVLRLTTATFQTGSFPLPQRNESRE